MSENSRASDLPFAIILQSLKFMLGIQQRISDEVFQPYFPAIQRLQIVLLQLEYVKFLLLRCTG